MTPLPDHIKSAWHLVALSKSVRRGGVRGLTVAGKSIVLFRTGEGLGAMLDRCPHRNYPLSQGRIRDNTLECPYHGWRFGIDGSCRAIPGCQITGQRFAGDRIAVSERHGGIFVRLGEGGSAEPELPPLVTGPGNDSFWWEQGVWEGRIYDAIENVLDPFHTNFIHHGFIRRHDRRQAVELEVNTFARGIEMVIQQPRPDHGLMSFFLERDRKKSRTRYYPPTIVQARWEGQERLTLCVTAFFTPVDESHFRPFACFTTPSGVAPGWLKESAIRLFLAPVIAQDRKALSDQFGVLRQFGGPRYLEGPGDILGSRVHRLYMGETVPEHTEPARTATL